MVAEQSHFDLSQLAHHIDGTRVYEQLVQSSMEEVLTLFAPEHQSEARGYLESCFTITVLQAIEQLPITVQTEFMMRLTATQPAPDGLAPVEWLLSTVKDTHPAFGEVLKNALVQTKNSIVAVMGEDGVTV